MNGQHVAAFAIGMFAFAVIVWVTRADRRHRSDLRREGLSPAGTPSFATVRELCAAGAFDREGYVNFPNWSAAVQLASVLEAAGSFRDASWIVFYGSAVRDSGRSAKDIDMCVVLPGDSPEITNSRGALTYEIDDGYGALTYRRNVLHIAVISESELIGQLRAGTEWATTLIRDGVLLAGSSDLSNDYRWRRTFARRRVLDWNIAPLTPVPLAPRTVSELTTEVST